MKITKFILFISLAVGLGVSASSNSYAIDNDYQWDLLYNPDAFRYQFEIAKKLVTQTPTPTANAKVDTDALIKNVSNSLTGLFEVRTSENSITSGRTLIRPKD